MGNAGYGQSTFLFYAESNDNDKGLRITVGDGRDGEPIWMDGKAVGGTEIYTTVTVERGPKANIFNPVRLYLTSKVSGGFVKSRLFIFPPAHVNESVSMKWNLRKLMLMHHFGIRKIAKGQERLSSFQG